MGLLTESSLLAQLFDYAGLFPPAGLSLSDARANFAKYLAGAHHEMLNTFVIAASRLNELPDAASAPVDGLWRLSVLSADWTTDRASIEQFQHRSRGYDVVSVETRQLSAATEIRRSFPVYVELPLDERLTDHVGTLGQIGAFAKIRMGGLTPDAFPACDAVARFLTTCCQHGVSFKATAGLHHPLRSERPTTTAEAAPVALMHGFVNVLSAVAAAINGAACEDVAAVLAQTEAAAFAELMRQPPAPRLRQLFHSIGSCSFEEPVADLQELSWL